jgi:4a-hydroxytetrahydrobiopterin dehydratase
MAAFDAVLIACTLRFMSKPLTSTQIATAIGTLPGWKHKGDALTKTFTFETFREAIGFMMRAAFEAEALNHHPDWSNVYNRVVVRLNTHDADDKVTAKDVELAKRIQKISWVG